VCGIVGCVNGSSVLPVLVDGLKRMEYRGYDSAGVALLRADRSTVIKRAGKLVELAAALDESKPTGAAGIGHSRWATHGAPTEVNAHPHVASWAGGSIALVHNGIIENYAELKAGLLTQGRTFLSETDTEVLAHLIAVARSEGKDLLEAVRTVLTQVRGTFALAILDSTEPGRMIGARRGSPLIVGVANDAIYLASDQTAILGHTDQLVFLDDDEIVDCRSGTYTVIDFEASVQRHEVHRSELQLEEIQKSGFPHFLLKEIHAQPEAVRDILRGRLILEDGISHLGGLDTIMPFLPWLDGIDTVACGTSYYAGLVGSYLLERMTELPVHVAFASEFRYRSPVVAKGTLGMVISQSGETADTLAALRELKRRGNHPQEQRRRGGGNPVIGLVNVVGSSIAREVDGGVYLHAGPEISVASTKAFTAQVIAQLLVGLQIGRNRRLPITEGQHIVRALHALPDQIQRILDRSADIEAIADRVAGYDHVMFLGRDALYPVALEGALKLKEVSYIQAEAHAAGEMKHGPIALTGPDLLTIYLCPKNDLYEKARSNLQEVKARGGTLVIVGTEGDTSLREFSDDVVGIPAEAPIWTQPILVNVWLQLLAYYAAVKRGTDVDQPRNLAKSVTVE